MDNTVKVVEIDQVREKLIELLITADDYEDCVCLGNLCKDCQYQGENCTYVAKADYLIANGVTLDNQVSSSKWIPVTERLPEKIGEHILVCYSDGWVCDQYTPVDGGVTHWMPLPEAPTE